MAGIDKNNYLRAWAVAALAATLAATLLALVALAEPAQAAKRIKTKTFANATTIQVVGGTPTASAPASPYPSKIEVSGFRRGRILDVNLKLKNVSHTWPRDVDVLLVGPRGQNAIVMSDVGGSNPGISGVTFTLDDESPNSLDQDVIPTSGTYKPTDEESPDSFPSPAPTPVGGSALSVFDGTRPNGTWKLYVVDDSSPDVGEFAGGWSLQIKAKVRRN